VINQDEWLKQNAFFINAQQPVGVGKTQVGDDQVFNKWHDENAPLMTPEGYAERFLDMARSEWPPEAEKTQWFINTPPPAKWAWTNDPDGYCRFHTPAAPNRFHRFMQKHLLGITWERID